jgi:hypothetical protein
MKIIEEISQKVAGVMKRVIDTWQVFLSLWMRINQYERIDHKNLHKVLIAEKPGIINIMIELISIEEFDRYHQFSVVHY